MKKVGPVINIIQDTLEVSRRLHEFFQDEEKVTVWLNTENPLLGDMAPIEMIFQGRTEKLLKFIDRRPFE